MKNKELAIIVHKAFNLLFDETRIKARCGDNKEAINIITYMTAENRILRDLGYMIGDSGRISKFKPINTKVS